MSKRIALKDSVMFDSVDLSDFCRSVKLTSEDEQVDVSGFNPTGSNEYLSGARTQSVTLEMFGSYGAGEVHATLYPIHRDREVVPFAWRPDQTLPASVTNPELRGQVQLLQYGPGATRGDVDTFEVTVITADATGLEFFTTPGP